MGYPVRILLALLLLHSLAGGGNAATQNEIMKFLTLIATIFMPLSFLASLWGMNFKFMPELAFRWGYPAALTLMVSAAIAMVFWFRKKRWF